MMKRFAAWFLAAVFLGGPACAGPIEDAAAAQLSGDPIKAVSILTPLAANGDAEAQELLGSIYDDGSRTPEIRLLQGKAVAVDLKTSLFWFKKAAEQGDGVAQLRVADFYQTGKAIPQDYVEAHKWYNLAAAHSEPMFSQAATEAKRRRELLAAQMTKDQIAEAQKLAREWRPKLDR